VTEITQETNQLVRALRHLYDQAEAPLASIGRVAAAFPDPQPGELMPSNNTE